MHRIEPVQLTLRTYVPRPVFEEQFSSGRGFSFKESPLYVKIKLLNPEIVFHKGLDAEKEELISVISYGLVRKKGIEIDCGPASIKTANYAAGELTEYDFVKSVQNQDGQRAKAELETRRIRHSFFSLLGTKHNFVTFDRLKDEIPRNNEHNDGGQELESSETVDVEIEINRSDFSDPEIDDLIMERINEGSRYSTAPTIVVDNGDVYDVADQVHYWLTQKGIVQIKRRRENDRIEEFGMYIERGLNSDEVVFNLNGQNEKHFSDIFKPMVMYYLRSGWTVLVECDLDLYEDDLPRIWDRVLEGDIHDMIYEPIARELSADISVERRVIEQLIHEEKNYIVIKPKAMKLI